MSKASSITLNIEQNSPDFELEPLESQSALFKYKYLSKTLDKAKEYPERIENFRSVTIKCLIKGCK
jgi:hypothetical protein